MLLETAPQPLVDSKANERGSRDDTSLVGFGAKPQSNLTPTQPTEIGYQAAAGVSWDGKFSSTAMPSGSRRKI